MLRVGASSGRDISTRDEIFYEQHEERPLVNMEDLGMRNAPITHITASPMPRRSSRIARLGSMIVPRYTATGSSGDDQQAHGQGRSLRRRLSNAQPSSSSVDGRAQRNRRTSVLGSMSPRSLAGSRTRQRRELAPISRPYPLNPDASLPPSGFEIAPLRETRSDSTPSTSQIDSPSTPRFIRDNSRLSRVRRSISSPFETLLSTSHNIPTQDRIAHTPPQRPSRLTPRHDSDFTLPSHNVAESNVSSEASGSDISNTEPRPLGISDVLESSEHPLPRPDGPSFAERWVERGSAVRRESRRMPSMLRGRSSRLIRRDSEGPLPRILHLAAAAIAAQLSGTPEQPTPDMQAIGPDDLDGSLQNLVRTLQNAFNLTTEPRNQENGPNASRPPNALPPLNFLRVFRFVSHPPSTERPEGRSRATDRTMTEHPSEDTDGRTVTLVVVGVRSVPSDSVGRGEGPGTEPSLDSLINLQTHVPSANVLRHGASGLLRHAHGRTRFPHRRRASIGGTNTFPANYDSQRHQRPASTSNAQGPGDVTNNLPPSALSESPPGPSPPPSTPAEPGLSAQSSADTTPSRRPSSASAIQQPLTAPEDIATRHLRETGLRSLEEQATGVQQRRRSDSEFARHRDLGAGAARRNGVVEPDEIDSGDVPPAGSRSWLIYVVGTSLSEDHPALTMPGLFADVSSNFLFIYSKVDHVLTLWCQNPTYEDLLLLSSLLGPAKPPVASSQDVAAASGIFRVESHGETLVAMAIQGEGELQIALSERCLVCLEDYQASEELRQLTKCSHLFHRECIDQVSQSLT